MKILVGMSGGVDSAIAAALLQREGHHVIGTTLLLWKEDADDAEGWTLTRSCCNVGLARFVCQRLSIPHQVADLREEFQVVVDDFCDTYLSGRTPNPCVLCNRHVKFAGLMRLADKWGCDAIATGHYARVEYRSGAGRTLLKKGSDRQKDQSYFLYRLSQEILARTRFPLGEMEKSEAYRIAAELGLPYDEVSQSQEACFLQGQGCGDFIAQMRSNAQDPGEIVTEEGEVIGAHRGIAFYTIGQRRGLGVDPSRRSLTAPAGERVYVTQIDPQARRLVVGPAGRLLRKEFSLEEVNWVSRSGIEGAGEGLTVRIRSRAPEVPAAIRPRGNGAIGVVCSEPVRGVAPGQSAVVYAGDEVVCGGIIG